MLKSKVELVLATLFLAHTAIGYAMLCTLIDPKLNPRDKKLHDVLKDILEDCLKNGKPILPALIWNHKLERPGNGFFKILRQYDSSVGATPRDMRAAWQKICNSLCVNQMM